MTLRTATARLLGAVAALASAGSAHALTLQDVWVQSLEGQRMLIAWREPGPVDVYVSERPSAPLSEMRRVADDDRDGRLEIDRPAKARSYFVLKSETTGETLRVAERLLPLQGGSNFRDVGGYPAANGKHVRWGLIYRSGAMPKLTDADYEYLDGLGIKATCDLRTVEERELAPHVYRGRNAPRPLTVDYSGEAIFGALVRGSTTGGVYNTGHHMLKPQLKQIFEALLAGEAPLSYNCSAGQDRTGMTTALVLTALGTPRDVIYADYHLSTAWRRPEYERLDMDYAKLAKTNVVARFYMQYAARGQDLSRPQPLYNAAGEPRLADSLRAIEAEYGSVLAYLDKELGVDAADIERLRALYTE